MATNRFQFSDDFVLKNGRVGINSADPQAELDVRGTIKADNLTVTGVATFTAYEGFLRSDYNIDESLTITNGSALSGEVIVGTGVTATNNAIDYAGQGQIDSLKVYNTFTPPRGGTEERPTKAKPGQLYYNEDFKTIEFYDGNVWRQVDNTTRSGRGVFGGGLIAPVYLSMIDYVHISSTGNAISFGDLSAPRRRVGGVSSETRGVFIRGTNSSNTRTNIMEYITIASGGNAISFGDGGVTGSTIGDGDGGCCSSSTRGIQAGGGNPSNHNIITYITIHTLGNALDFGDLSAERHQIASFSSPTRAIHYSGYIGAGSFSSAVDTHLISSTGNAVDFADPLIPRYGSNACSNSTRGIISAGDAEGGAPNATNISTLTTMNTSSTGSESVFGDLSVLRTGVSATSTQTRGVFGGGYASPSRSNVIDYVQMQTTGNAIDFGDLTTARSIYNGISDSHGGLGGF